MKTILVTKKQKWGNGVDISAHQVPDDKVAAFIVAQKKNPDYLKSQVNG